MWSYLRKGLQRGIIRAFTVVVTVVVGGGGVVITVLIFLRSFSVLLASCPALTVGRLVKTSPSSCVTPQMKINTNCSFSCPKGYQLKGPSYKQCGSSGNWTDSAKSVTCTGGLY